MSTFHPWTPQPPQPSVLSTPLNSQSSSIRSQVYSGADRPTPSSTTTASPDLSPVVATPEGGGSWAARYKDWGGEESYRGGVECGRVISGFQGRTPLCEVSQNTPALALASPFNPHSSGVWGPPVPPGFSGARTLSVEEKLNQAEEKIRDLTIENQRLRQRGYSGMLPSSEYVSPPLTAHSSMFDLRSVNTAMYGLGFGRFEDPEIISQMARSIYQEDESTLTAGYVPPPYMIASVLHGTFNFADMHPEYIRPIVWVVAHRPPKNNSESAGLKAAVNALATRLGQPRQSEGVIRLVAAIIEWAKQLCFTSCGNYLCQQLLERGETEDKMNFIKEVQDDIVGIASDKFGTHVLCKAIVVKELQEPIADALLKHGIYDGLKTGARRLWREYLEICRLGKDLEIFFKINEDMSGKWADLACVNEHGSIACQQVFEVYGSQELMDPCFRELLEDISRVANNQFGHFVITKLIGYPNLYRSTCDALLLAYPPVATTHHGVNFAKIALTEGGRASIVKYVEGICSQEDGRTPGIVSIATSSIGKAHLAFVFSCLTPAEHVRVRQVCRAFSTTLRNSQSGNDLLRSLGLIHAVGTRHRTGPA